MKLFNFIVGILGVLLIIGTLSFFFPIIILGGLTTQSLAFAFGLPILLFVVGATMIYVGFYYQQNSVRGNDKLSMILKEGFVFSFAIFLSYYIFSKILIANDFLVLILTALIALITIQAFKNHQYGSIFRMKWAIFDFLVYSIVIWFIGEFLFPKIIFQPGIYQSIILGFSLAITMSLIYKLKLKSTSIPWISFILLIILLVVNINFLQDLTSYNLNFVSQNDSGTIEEKRVCPSIESTPVSIGLGSSMKELSEVIDSSVWAIENEFRSCYYGMYRGQYLDWIYCDDMIVSRWDLGGEGAINHKWYTSVTAEWKPYERSGETVYMLDDFSCDNGKKVTVDKERTSYYVHVSRDGTEIKVEY